MPATAERDDEIIATEERAHRIRLRTAFATAAATVLCTALVAVAARTGVVQHLALDEAAAEWLMAAIPFVLLLPLAYVSWRYWPRPETCEPRILRKQIDRYQARGRLVSLLLLLILATQVLNLMRNPPGSGADWMGWATLVSFAFLLVVTAAHLLFGFGFARRSFREGLDDEFARALRARTARVGFLAAIAIGTAAYAMIAEHALAARFALPLALFAGIAVPLCYSVVADLQAN